MPYSVIEQIVTIIESFGEKEKEEFKCWASKNKRDSKYLKLFEIISNNLEHSKIDDLVNSHFEKIDDLKQNLLHKLFQFLSFQDNHLNKRINEIKDSLNLVDVLVDRKLYSVAIQLIEKNYAALESIELRDKSSHLFIQYLNQVVNLIYNRPDRRSLNLPREFERKGIHWINEVAKKVAESFNTEGVDLDEEIFQNTPFLFLSIDYLKKNKRWKQAYDNTYKFGTGLNFPSDTKIKLNELNAFRLLELSLHLNEPEKIKHALQLIEFKDQSKLYYRQFVYFTMFVENLKIKLSLNDFHDFNKAKFSDPFLFAETEILNVPLRLEVNKGIVLLLTKKYDLAHKQFEDIPKSKFHPKDPLLFYITLLEIISFGGQGVKKDSIDQYEKDLKYLFALQTEKTEFISQVIRGLEDDSFYKNREFQYELIHFSEGVTLCLFEQVIVRTIKNFINWNEY